MLDQSKKITYKISYLYSATSATPIEAHIVDKAGKQEYIDIYGAHFFTAPPNGALIKSYNLNAVENYTFMQFGKEVQGKRPVCEISYWPEELEELLSVEERIENKINKECHNLFKKHQNVVIKSKDGHNVNPNQTGTPLYQLIEETAEVNALVTKNRRAADANAELSHMLELEKERLVDFCYAYGITPIEGVAIERLYNKAVAKATLNPDHFFEILNHKDSKMLTYIERAKLKQIGDDNLITLKGSQYYMEGEAVGGDEEEMIRFFNRFPRKKEYMLGRLGITPEIAPEVITLPKVEESLEYTPMQQNYNERTTNTLETEMKMRVGKLFKDYEKAKAADPSKAGELLEKAKADVEKLRSKYISIADHFNDYISKKRFE